jgi:hypothetical protein
VFGVAMATQDDRSELWERRIHQQFRFNLFCNYASIDCRYIIWCDDNRWMETQQENWLFIFGNLRGCDNICLFV